MKNAWNVIICLVVGCFVFSAVQSALGQAASEEDKRWSLTGGVKVRKFEADFYVTTPNYDLRSGFSSGTKQNKNSTTTMGAGDIGIYTMDMLPNNTGILRNAPVLNYNEGYVGVWFDRGFGLVNYGFNSLDAINILRDTGRTTTGNAKIEEMTFTSTGKEIITSGAYTKTSVSQSGSFGNGIWGDDDTVAAGPFAELRYELIENENMRIGGLVGWSYFDTSLNYSQRFGSNSKITKTTESFSGMTTTTTKEYKYIYDTFSINPNGNKDFLLSEVADGRTLEEINNQNEQNTGVIIDAAIAKDQGSLTNMKDPRKSVTSSTSTSGTGKKKTSSSSVTFMAYGGSDVDIDFHEILIAPEIEIAYKDLFLSLAFGPTINIIDWELTAWQKVYRNDQTEAVYSNRAYRSDDVVKVGFAIQVSMEYTFWEEKDVYLYGSGGYSWVDDEDVSNEISQANIELSSWTASLGLGIRF